MSWIAIFLSYRWKANKLHIVTSTRYFHVHNMHRFPFCFTRYLGIWPSCDATLLTRFSKEWMYYLVNLFSPSRNSNLKPPLIDAWLKTIFHVVCTIYANLQIVIWAREPYLTKPVLEIWTFNISSVHLKINIVILVSNANFLNISPMLQKSSK